MSSVTVNIRMEQSLKRDLERFCAEIGLSMNTLFNIYVRTVVRAQRIPFTLGHQRLQTAAPTEPSTTSAAVQPRGALSSQLSQFTDDYPN